MESMSFCSKYSRGVVTPKCSRQSLSTGLESISRTLGHSWLRKGTPVTLETVVLVTVPGLNLGEPSL